MRSLDTVLINPAKAQLPDHSSPTRQIEHDTDSHTITHGLTFKTENSPATPSVRTRHSIIQSFATLSTEGTKIKLLENITSLDSLTPDTLGLLIREQEEKVTISNLTVCICYKQAWNVLITRPGRTQWLLEFREGLSRRKWSDLWIWCLFQENHCFSASYPDPPAGGESNRGMVRPSRGSYQRQQVAVLCWDAIW